MKRIFVIGGMGAGKSMASEALAEQGLPTIDLDEIGHEVLERECVKADLADAFGEDILDEKGEVDRVALAAKAFSSAGMTDLLNSITMPRIEEAFAERIESIKQDTEAVVVEFSAFKNREASLIAEDDCVIAVLAPLEARIERAVAAGWDEDDVRRRIARQITDAERRKAADVVFCNDSSPDKFRCQVADWWGDFKDNI